MFTHRVAAPMALAIAVSLGGCVASNPVYKVADGVPDNVRGAAFYLPQTRLTLGFVQQSLTYTEGEHTSVVEQCEATPPAAPLALCARFERLGVTSLRPGFKDGDACEGDETRVGFKTFTLASAAIPDPTQVYVVDLKRNWFQDFNFAMELDAYGVVGKAQAKTVEKAAEDGLAFGASLFGRMAGIPPIKPASGTPVSVQNSPEAQAAWTDLDLLEGRIVDRSLLVAALEPDTLSRNAVAIAQLNAEIAQLMNKFTGKRVVEESDPMSVSFVPRQDSEGQDIEVHAYDHCGGDDKNDKLKVRLSTAWDNVLPESDVLIATPSAAPGQKNLRSTPATAADIHARLAQLNAEDDEQGWPHRMPVLTSASVLVCAPTCKPPKFLGDVGIAQYGQVYRLPARTGGKSSNIAASYSALGSLNKVEVDQEGQSAAPIFNTLAPAFAERDEPAQPKEAELLAAEIALIKSRQELCRLIYGVDDERCLGANPPVE